MRANRSGQMWTAGARGQASGNHWKKRPLHSPASEHTLLTTVRMCDAFLQNSMMVYTNRELGITVFLW